MTRVLLFATTTGYQIRSFGEAAARIGVRLVIASDRCDQLDDPWWDQAIPVRFHEEPQSQARLVAALGDTPPDGIIAVGDRPTVLAALAAEAFGLEGNPPAAAAASRNKLASRRALADAGLRTPSFDAFPVASHAATIAATVGYPAVVKPLALSGSRGVIRVNDRTEFVAAFERIRRLLASPDVRLERDTAHDQVIVESFVPGDEFAVEGVLTAGAFRAFAIFDKPDPLDGPFFEETIYVTPSRCSATLQEQLIASVAAAAGALRLRHGPVHAECRVNERGVYVLEVAPRPIGGLCSKALRFVHGERSNVSLEEVLLRHAIGEDISDYGRERLASAVMMIPIPRRGVYRGVEGLEEARAVPDVEDLIVSAKVDSVVVPLPEGRSYLGFIFARSRDAARAELAVRAAHARLRFLIEKDLVVV